jgi:hypothetical protein
MLKSYCDKINAQIVSCLHLKIFNLFNFFVMFMQNYKMIIIFISLIDENQIMQMKPRSISIN